MTSRLREIAERAERVIRERDAWHRMMEGLRERQILDLMDLTTDEVIQASREIHAGHSEEWLARVAASLADAEARREAGERPRWAEEPEPGSERFTSRSGHQVLRSGQ